MPPPSALWLAPPVAHVEVNHAVTNGGRSRVHLAITRGVITAKTIEDAASRTEAGEDGRRCQGMSRRPPLA